MSIPISKTLDEVRDDLFARIAAVQQDGWLPGNLSLNKGVVRGIIELWAWGLYQLYAFLVGVLAQAFPNTATGPWLDLHCLGVEVRRLLATKAHGTVYFTRVDTSGNVPIPAGRIIKTKPDGQGIMYRYVTLADVVLLDGDTEVAVTVEAEEYGKAANVVEGQITEISTVIPGVDAVENRPGWLTTEGADKEDDDSLRERYVLAWSDVNGATKYAYESWARSITGVVAVSVADQHPRGQGTLDVLVRGTAGMPTQELLDAVDAVVQLNRPVNDDVLVKGPTGVPVTITAELEIVTGDSGSIIAEAENRIRAMFLDPSPVADVAPILIGEDFTVDRLTKEIMEIDGVKLVNWSSPASDVEVPVGGLATLQSLTITTVVGML